MCTSKKSWLRVALMHRDVTVIGPPRMSFQVQLLFRKSEEDIRLRVLFGRFQNCKGSRLTHLPEVVLVFGS